VLQSTLRLLTIPGDSPSEQYENRRHEKPFDDDGEIMKLHVVVVFPSRSV